MIDAHIHLNQYPNEQIDELIKQWQEAGIIGIVAVSTNLKSAYQILEWQSKYSSFIYATVGYHPEQPYPTHNEINEILALLNKEKHRISGIGEVGIPHYSFFEKFAVEKYSELLEEFAKEAVLNSLPLALHAVHDKTKIAFDILQKYHVPSAHFHWLKAPKEMVNQLIEANYFISLTPEVYYRERDQRLAELIPLSHLMLETDGPWTFSSIFENKQTNPTFLFHSAKAIANIKQIEVTEVIKTCIANTLGIYSNLKIT